MADPSLAVKRVSALDPGYVPAVLWNRAYRSRVEADPGREALSIALVRPDDTVTVYRTMVLPHEGANAALNRRYVERLVKFLLWQRGGSTIIVGGNPALASLIADIYCPDGERAFDCDLIGRKAYRSALRVEHRALAEVPAAREPAVPLGRHLEGCRIGFDLGGSDRKSAAVVDGEVVFSDEVKWDPYFESDPEYHIAGIRDSLKRAAAKLPRVDAVGGSAAGIYVNNEVRVASLFRGVSAADFDARVRRLFLDLQEEWGGIPFDVANDGEVTALAGSMSLQDNAVLGVSMGTSQAAGYVDPEGHITPGLNELAFVPVDYRDNGPVDEWSGDCGCGVQYFSQQAVARLAPLAGIELADETPLPERLVEVQRLMGQGDPRAQQIYETIGIYFGYSIAHYAEFYEIRNLLVLGRVTSGRGGEVIVATAEGILGNEFPELAETIRLQTPDETLKRHGQAIAAASLPRVEREEQ